MKKLFLALPLAALAACGGNASDSTALGKDVLMHTDVDNLSGWMSDPTALTKANAHSGQYSLFVDQNREFGAGYNAVLGQLSPTRIKGVRLDAWVFVPNKEAAAKLVFSIRDANNKDLLYDQTNLEQVSDFNKWVKVTKEITLPATANYTSLVVVYLWRAGSPSPVYLDDLQLTALR